MPLRDFKCLSCEKVQERYYGFIDGEEDIPTCFDEDCGGQLEKQPLTASVPKTAVFPYTCTHVDGKGTPITVESIGHLRSLEKKYGVCFSEFSQNRSNPDSPRDLPEHRIGGEEYRGERFR
jgi:hypothetical protein